MVQQKQKKQKLCNNYVCPISNLIVLLQTWQVHHWPDLHTTSNPKKDPRYTDRHTPFIVNYKLAFDSPIGDLVFAAISECGISAKVIKLCRITLSNSCNSINKWGQNEVYVVEKYGVAAYWTMADNYTFDIHTYIIRHYNPFISITT